MMTNIIKKIAERIGMDKAIAYSSGARIIQAFTGVATIFFIATFLSGEEQGFYYTFGSLLSIQIFFELGLTGIITQYVAHEAAHVKILDNGNIEGEGKYRSRLASLIHFSAKWYAIISILFLIIVVIAGLVFFKTFDESCDTISWRIPWVLICIGSAIKLFQSPFTSILMGLDKVKEMNKIGFYQQIILPTTLWLGLILGWKLYVVGISSIIAALIWNIYIARTSLQRIIVNLWKENITERISYMQEIFPYQWRIALSWVSGYFIFQLFNPVLFATEGAAVAGKMGMTLNVMSAIQALALSWLFTKVPLYSRLIALKDYLQLDRVFKSTVKNMSLVCFTLFILMILGVWLLRVLNIEFNGNKLGERFLDFGPMLLMMASAFINLFVNAWATYLRCHKKEPFLINSICAGVLCTLSTILLGKLYGLYGITIGYFSITLALLPWSYYLFYSNKKKWHESK